MKHHNEELQKLRSTLAEEQKPLNELKNEQELSKLHKKLTFPILISSVNVTKSIGTADLVTFIGEILHGKLQNTSFRRKL